MAQGNGTGQPPIKLIRTINQSFASDKCVFFMPHRAMDGGRRRSRRRDRERERRLCWGEWLTRLLADIRVCQNSYVAQSIRCCNAAFRFSSPHSFPLFSHDAAACVALYRDHQDQCALVHGRQSKCLSIPMTILTEMPRSTSQQSIWIHKWLNWMTFSLCHTGPLSHPSLLPNKFSS